MKSIVAAAAAIGMLPLGAAVTVSASPTYCMEKQTLQQFKQETAGLFGALKAKEIELGEQAGYVAVEGNPPTNQDVEKVFALESQINELRAKINEGVQKYGIICVQLP